MKIIVKLTIMMGLTFILTGCFGSGINIKEPSDPSKSPGMVAYMIYGAEEIDGKIMTSNITFTEHAKLINGAFKDVNYKSIGLGKWGNYTFLTELEPGETYAISRLEAFTAYRTNSIILYYDLNDKESLEKISVEPGKIKFLGVFAVYIKDNKFKLVDGIDFLNKNKSKIKNADAFYNGYFTENEINHKGAFKKFLDYFVEYYKNDGYWKDLAIKTRKRLK